MISLTSQPFYTIKLLSQMKFALLSVYDKTGIIELAKVLDKLSYKIISTGGTAKVLSGAGIDIIPIQEITGNPESFDGRMKTISFQIESGILYDRTNPSHNKEARKLGLKPIDVVVCNLYPFEQTIKKSGISLDEAVEQIDVGGPTMVRAAAKNYKNVLVITDPNDYERISKALQKEAVTSELRQELAAKAFNHLSFYDSQVARFLNQEKFPQELTIPGRFSLKLRYGENPHQEGSVYLEPNSDSPMSNLKFLAGKEGSATNITDIAAGIESVRIFREPCAVVIKHNSPCGIALGKNIKQALERAVEADPLSAFGGIIVLNAPLDLETARRFAKFKENKVQVDIIAAPRISNGAVEFLRTVRKSTGLYSFGKIPIYRKNKQQVKTFYGGFILQDWDDTNADRTYNNWKAVGLKPTKKQIELMKFGWKVIGRVKSNTILVIDSKIPMTRGIGSGQTSRVGSCQIALKHAGKFVKRGILVSDSFFPFDDCVKLASKYKIGAIIQQGGSVNDKSSIDAAKKAKIPMILTGERKFWH